MKGDSRGREFLDEGRGQSLAHDGWGRRMRETAKYPTCVGCGGAASPYEYFSTALHFRTSRGAEQETDGARKSSITISGPASGGMRQPRWKSGPLMACHAGEIARSSCDTAVSDMAREGRGENPATTAIPSRIIPGRQDLIAARPCRVARSARCRDPISLEDRNTISTTCTSELLLLLDKQFFRRSPPPLNDFRPADLLRRSRGRGGVVVRLLASHLGEPGCSRIFVCEIRAGRYRWSAGLLRDLPFPLPFHSGTAPYSPLFNLIGSRDLDANGRPNLFQRGVSNCYENKSNHTRRDGRRSSFPFSHGAAAVNTRVGGKIFEVDFSNMSAGRELTEDCGWRTFGCSSTLGSSAGRVGKEPVLPQTPERVHAQIPRGVVYQSGRVGWWVTPTGVCVCWEGGGAYVPPHASSAAALVLAGHLLGQRDEGHQQRGHDQRRSAPLHRPPPPPPQGKHAQHTHTPTRAHTRTHATPHLRRRRPGIECARSAGARLCGSPLRGARQRLQRRRGPPATWRAVAGYSPPISPSPLTKKGGACQDPLDQPQRRAPRHMTRWEAGPPAARAPRVKMPALRRHVVGRGLGSHLTALPRAVPTSPACAYVRAKFVAVAGRLDCSPSAKANLGFNPGRVTPGFSPRGNCAGRCHWSAGFYRRSPVPPALSFRSCSILTSFHHHHRFSRPRC
ncbi:hypothetical protein PR048_031421 [Dryococelus australis]|uniref:Uncharacterized protein n=1 Tax=Dryococelus australis TaxID=614101 RepID=A0ABQ9G5Y2_9NEOP|nr:hypothetical protein PR048_031421 [Dryococelus australis]